MKRAQCALAMLCLECKCTTLNYSNLAVVEEKHTLSTRTDMFSIQQATCGDSELCHSSDRATPKSRTTKHGTARQRQSDEQQVDDGT